ncbi:hypothetical protein J25TS5_29760 [Paenibacillus faecis]|nr:hypothetical protein J25TS5_29760 [Paenibacillus faecis]
MVVILFQFPLLHFTRNEEEAEGEKTCPLHADDGSFPAHVGRRRDSGLFWKLLWPDSASQEK